MLTTTLYKCNLVVVHELCSTVQDLTWQGHVHAELLVVTNLFYKHLIALTALATCLYAISIIMDNRTGNRIGDRPMVACCSSLVITSLRTRMHQHGPHRKSSLLLVNHLSGLAYAIHSFCAGPTN